MPLLGDEARRSNGRRGDFFDAPTNPMREMNNQWQAAVEKVHSLRIVGYAWDASLLLVLVSYIRYVLTDPYGLGSSFQAIFITLGGFVFVALILAFFARPVGRAAILLAAAFIRIVARALHTLFDGRRRPRQ